MTEGDKSRYTQGRVYKICSLETFKYIIENRPSHFTQNTNSKLKMAPLQNGVDSTSTAHERRCQRGSDEWVTDLIHSLGHLTEQIIRAIDANRYISRPL
ncbi:hypothetical protein EVAR_59820_1 [Eumeta japonica]|uniref:Uncharacterized protein n=1 Tax=Eumeta variegata TaxID=151549 RepID=A0A4C1Z900_EUMVA|nr:hypothetical protein EVAR_59820_1 [Eumeta japonica]